MDDLFQNPFDPFQEDLSAQERDWMTKRKLRQADKRGVSTKTLLEMRKRFGLNMEGGYYECSCESRTWLDFSGEYMTVGTYCNGCGALL